MCLHVCVIKGVSPSSRCWCFVRIIWWEFSWAAQGHSWVTGGEKGVGVGVSGWLWGGLSKSGTLDPSRTKPCSGPKTARVRHIDTGRWVLDEHSNYTNYHVRCHILYVLWNRSGYSQGLLTFCLSCFFNFQHVCTHWPYLTHVQINAVFSASMSSTQLCFKVYEATKEKRHFKKKVAITSALGRGSN